MDHQELETKPMLIGSNKSSLVISIELFTPMTQFLTFLSMHGDSNMLTLRFITQRGIIMSSVMMSKKKTNNALLATFYL